MAPDPDKVSFTKVLEALRPYLDDLTIVRGWAHRLLAFHELARPPSFEPLMTQDADIATPLRLRSRGQPIA